MRLRLLAMLTATVVAIPAAAIPAATQANAAPDPCQFMASNVHSSINPASGVQLLTSSDSEVASAAAKYGYTQIDPDLGQAASEVHAGLVAVHRLYRQGKFAWSADAADIARFVAAGWQDQSTNFWASAAPAGCMAKAERFTKGGLYRTVTSDSAKASLKAAGWTADGAGFYLEAPANDTEFSIAVLNDTQGETNEPANTRFLSQTNWLTSNQQALDLRYVLHTGDVTNWGWLDQPQYDRAKTAMGKLSAAQIPYSVSAGNHDTRAVGWDASTGLYGGDAYIKNPECLTRFDAATCKSQLLVRHTEEFNANFPTAGLTGLGGSYETGKSENNWTTFTAGGKKWLVLTLELWPRKAVVAWAKNIVATHADYNVIIQTHSYLNPDGSISTSNGGYGETSPSYLFEQVVKPYQNVKMVFSGHAGTATSRTDTGANGNKVLSFLVNDLGASANPVRVVTINTATGTIATRVYSPIQTKYYDAYATSAAGVKFAG